MKLFLQLTTTAFVLCIACAHAASSPVGEITDVVVEENGIGQKTKGCESFSVTASQVREFFERAVLVSGRQYHDYFQHGPCYAQGTLKSRYDTWKWEIRNLGSGTLTATNGDVFQFGNPDEEVSPED